MDLIDLSQALREINFYESTRMVQCLESLFFASFNRNNISNRDSGMIELFKVD